MCGERQYEIARPLCPDSPQGDQYDLLLSTAGEKGPYVINRPILISVDVRIPLAMHAEADYTDIVIEIPIKYYVVGYEVPAELVVRRSMRVVYIE